MRSRGLRAQLHDVALSGPRHRKAGLRHLIKTLHQLGDLSWINEHSLHLGALVRPSHPATNAHVGSPARRMSRENGRQITRSETDQGIDAIEAGNHQLAHLPLCNRFSGAGANDLDDVILVDDHAFACGAFVGDYPQIGGRVTLRNLNSTCLVFLPQRGEQGTAGDKRTLD